MADNPASLRHAAAAALLLASSGVALAGEVEIVEAHGGRIWHQALAEGGCAFCFTLPGGAR
jgi:signal transduction histidine kinase